jgi:5'(3')-deoxyribonucleotidase
MQKIKVGIDMDGVIVDWVSLARKNILDNWNIDILTETSSIRTIDLLRSKVPELQFISRKDIYSIVCPPGFFEEAKPYDKAIEAVIDLSKIAQSVFITKPLDYKYCTNEKVNWLNKYFSAIDYDLVFVKDGRTKGLVDVDYMIDDDPYVIENIKTAKPIMIKRNYNKEWRENNNIELAFDSMHCVYNYLKFTTCLT